MNTAKKSSTGKVLIIALVITILFSLLNWGIVSGWGDVKITQLSLVGDDGSNYTALMYVPKAASNENKVPALLSLHGASGNGRNHEQYALEYARRGFIVISPDSFGSGDGTYKQGMVDTWKINAAELYWKYMVECPMVDTTRTVVNGHSIGSTGTLHLAAKYNPTVAIPIDGFMGVYPSKDNLHYTGMICAITGDADAQNVDKYLTPLKGLFELDPAIKIDGDMPEFNKIYGSFEAKNAKVLYLTPHGHEDAMNSHKGLEVQLDFVQKAMTVPNPIPGSDQIWQWKDVFGQLGMFSFAFTLVAFAVYLMERNAFFAGVKQPLPRNIGLRKVGLAISVVCAIVFPLIVLKTGSFGLRTLTDGNAISLFTMGRANRAFSVVIGLSILGLLTFILFLFTDGKKQNAKLVDYGMTSAGSTKLDWKLIGKSALLAFVVLAAGFAYLRLQRQVLGTDFYCLYWGYKPIAWNKFIYMVPYIIVWCICFIMAGVGMNIERRLPDTGNEKKDMAIACVVNVVLAILTISVVLLIQLHLQRHVLFRTATSMSTWKADLTRLWGMPAGVAVGTFINTYLYRKSGSIWPGVFLGGALCALGCVLYGGHGLYG